MGQISKSFVSSDDTEELARELLEVYLKYTKQFSQLVDTLSASGEYGILYFLLHSEESCSAGELADVMGLSPGRVANVLKALEKKGLIVRTKDSVDRRKSIVSITDKGVSCMMEGYSSAECVYKALIEEIGVEDARTFIRITQKIFRFSQKIAAKCEDAAEN